MWLLRTIEAIWWSTFMSIHLSITRTHTTLSPLQAVAKPCPTRFHSNGWRRQKLKMWKKTKVARPFSIINSRCLSTNNSNLCSPSPLSATMRFNISLGLRMVDRYRRKINSRHWTIKPIRQWCTTLLLCQRVPSCIRRRQRRLQGR